MADFSELCPLFKTGVFHEVTFPGPMSLSAVLTQRNLLAGTGAAAKEGYFTFGRTVVVTNAWIRKEVATNATTTELCLVHKTSGTAALSGTAFATIALASNDGSQFEVGYSWQPFTAFIGKTFTSSEVLSLQIVPAFTVSSGKVALMVRYREA